MALNHIEYSDSSRTTRTERQLTQENFSPGLTVNGFMYIDKGLSRISSGLDLASKKRTGNYRGQAEAIARVISSVRQH